MSEEEHRTEEHPRGTLAILTIYGVLFVVGWLVIYLLVYTPRGGVHP